MTTEEIIAGLREEIATRKAELARLEGALEVLAPAPPAPANAEPEPPAVLNAVLVAPAVNGATLEPEARPRLRDAVPRVLRDNDNVPMTMNAIAVALHERGWLGGSNGPSRETVRQVIATLRQQGIVTVVIPPNEKAAVVQLTNALLPVAPQ